MLSKIDILGSGSSGNAYVLYFDNNKIIQLDAGIKNEESSKVNKLYISHLKHKDHDKYIKDFKCDIILKSDIKIPHIVDNYAYIIEEDNEKIAYITDCGNYKEIDIDLSNCTYVFIECNWDYFLIKQKVIKAQEYAFYSFSDKGHMSNLDTLNAIAKWKVNKDCKIMFIHKSGNHANWDSTYNIFKCLPNKNMFVAGRGKGTLFCKAWTSVGEGRML